MTVIFHIINTFLKLLSLLISLTHILRILIFIIFVFITHTSLLMYIRSHNPNQHGQCNTMFWIYSMSMAKVLSYAPTAWGERNNYSCSTRPCSCHKARIWQWFMVKNILSTCACTQYLPVIYQGDRISQITKVVTHNCSQLGFCSHRPFLWIVENIEGSNHEKILGLWLASFF
jgi:hypothetical protein